MANLIINCGKFNCKLFHHAVFFFVILFLIILSACSSGTGTFRGIDLHTGSEGIVINFVGGLPPEEINEGQSYKIGVELRNKGAWTATNARLFIGGPSSKYTKIGRPEVTEIGSGDNPLILRSFEGKTFENPEGGYRLVIYDIENKGVPTTSEKFTESFFIKICYGYKTQASVDVCIDPNEGNPLKLDNPACQVQTSQSLQPQGAPVAVSRIEQKIIQFKEGSVALFKIYLSNVGGGRIYSVNNYGTECSLEKKENLEGLRNKVLFLAYKKGDSGVQRILCGKNLLDLDQNVLKPFEFDMEKDEYVECAFPIESKEAYITPLTINLTYGYVSEIRTSVDVKPLGKNKKISYEKLVKKLKKD